jgi:hypothetical protein
LRIFKMFHVLKNNPLENGVLIEYVCMLCRYNAVSIEICSFQVPTQAAVQSQGNKMGNQSLQVSPLHIR